MSADGDLDNFQSFASACGSSVELAVARGAPAVPARGEFEIGLDSRGLGGKSSSVSGCRLIEHG